MTEESKVEAHVVPRLTSEQLEEFVEGFMRGQYYTSAHVPADMWPMIFMPIPMGAFKDWTEEEVGQIGLLYEDMNEAGPLGINGHPSFFSFRFMHRDDWDIARKRIKVANDALKAAARGESDEGK